MNPLLCGGTCLKRWPTGNQQNCNWPRIIRLGLEPMIVINAPTICIWQGINGMTWLLTGGYVGVEAWYSIARFDDFCIVDGALWAGKKRGHSTFQIALNQLCLCLFSCLWNDGLQYSQSNLQPDSGPILIREGDSAHGDQSGRTYASPYVEDDNRYPDAESSDESDRQQRWWAAELADNRQALRLMVVPAIPGD